MTRKARLYTGLVISCGSVVLAYSLYRSFTAGTLQWLYLAAFAIFGGSFPVYLPGTKKKGQGVALTISDAFTFTAILLYGPAVAATVAVVDSCATAIRARRSISRAYKVLFNITHLALATFIAGHVFYLMYGSGMPLDPSDIHHVPALLVSLGVCSLLYYFLDSGAVALAIFLVSGQSLLETWRRNFLWTPLIVLASASGAAVIFLNFNQWEFFALGIAIPIVILAYYGYAMNLHRVKQAQQHLEEVQELYHSTIACLAMAIDAKDQRTHGHVHRVQALALGLAQFCGVTDDDQLDGLRAAALLHDVGKLAIPDHILNKPGALTELEFQKMKMHAAVGAEILSSVTFPYPVVPFVRHHHEKWNGTGYPDGLKGEQIPLGARILSIADCYDALRSDRPYRPELPRPLALEHIQAEAGKSFDPALVQQLVLHIDELEAPLAGLDQKLPSDIISRIERDIRLHEAGEPSGMRRTVFHNIASTQAEILTLFDFSRTVGKSLSVAETLTLLTSKIRTMVPYSSCAVYLLNADDETMRPHHTAGAYAELLDGLELTVGEGVSGWVAANKRPLFNVVPAPDFGALKLLRAQLKSCVAVPLLLDDQVVGVITLYSSNPDAYEHDHLRLMETIAIHAAPAIRNALIYEETQEDAYTDPLTGLPNARYLNVFLAEELKRASRLGYPVTLLMMDLECFKEVNDRHGHPAGDRMLVEIGHILRNQLRKSDTCLRYGGDEFIGILPGVGGALGEQAIERIQAAVDSHRMPIEPETSVHVGISIGAATFPLNASDADTLIAAADRAMYANKNRRRPTRLRHASSPGAALGVVS